MALTIPAKAVLVRVQASLLRAEEHVVDTLKKPGKSSEEKSTSRLPVRLSTRHYGDGSARIICKVSSYKFY
ncbi:hypothetical protein HIM_08684 [Hirsutella minnesotensis 3608]|uniref:Uncharacterized protein n=1 Tax=Hirsutella minnesotensis 3608 TaxID=1043627 RepID=A0A0F7ZST6_9HYPO|nr:hypothetical protein HIM_08684 [Hirsutella minnesotensis 3608]